MARLWGFRPAMQEAARVIPPPHANSSRALSTGGEGARQPDKAERQRPGPVDRNRRSRAGARRTNASAVWLTNREDRRPEPPQIALCAGAALGQRHQLDAVASSGQRQLAVLQRQRILAEDLSAPPRQRADWGVVIGRDRLQIVSRGDQLLRYVVILATLLQQDAQQLDQRAEAGRQLGLPRMRRRRVRVLQALLDRVENVAAELPF